VKGKKKNRSFAVADDTSSTRNMQSHIANTNSKPRRLIKATRAPGKHETYARSSSGVGSSMIEFSYFSQTHKTLLHSNAAARSLNFGIFKMRVSGLFTPLIASEWCVVVSRDSMFCFLCLPRTFALVVCTSVHNGSFQCADECAHVPWCCEGCYGTWSVLRSR
jgi:hypothetical protein